MDLWLSTWAEARWQCRGNYFHRFPCSVHYSLIPPQRNFAFSSTSTHDKILNWILLWNLRLVHITRALTHRPMWRSLYALHGAPNRLRESVKGHVRHREERIGQQSSVISLTVRWSRFNWNSFLFILDMRKHMNIMFRWFLHLAKLNFSTSTHSIWSCLCSAKWNAIVDKIFCCCCLSDVRL